MGTLAWNGLRLQLPLAKHSHILPLPSIFTSNLIKVGGPIRHSNKPEQNKQILLPADHYITSLAVTQFHKKYRHCGRDQTPTVIREFWIVNGKSVATRLVTVYHVEN